MGAKHFGRALLVVLLCPGAAWALGLGDIKLNSALNAPLDADIELLGAAPEELTSLKAQLASRETFAKYGLEYPGFLSSVTLVRGKSASGRDVLRVTSQETITEPFVTLLVDVNWGRGRLVREYTVLLDPPVFTPGNAPAAPVSQAGTGSARAGTIERSAPANAAPAADQPVETSPVETSSDTYNVRRGDTLSGIAGRIGNNYSGATREQLMLALYRSNPAAFDGTMNELRNGSILRLPAAAALSGISAAAASAETSRQYSAWRGRGGAGAASGAGRLRLVAPNETGTGSGGAATAADVKGLRDRLSQLETQLNESRRMLELKNAELADLQRRLSASSSAGSAAAAKPPTAAPTPEVKPPAIAASEPVKPATAAPAPAEPQTEVPAAAATPVAPPAAGPANTEGEAASKPAVAEPVRPRPRVVEEAPVEEPSFLAALLASATSAIKDFWYVPVALLAALLAFFGFRKFRASRPGGDEFAVSRYDQDETQTAAGDDFAEVTERPVEQIKSRRPTPATPSQDRGMLVEESGELEQPKFASSSALRSEDTLSGETGINLDQSDPLAEADFHMAYGLYDQAADLVRTAILREPNRRDLKLKLVEVFFVWGNRDEFLTTARELHASRSEAAAGEWDKIVIMGRQIAPEDPLFSGSPATGNRTEAVDLDLHPGESKLDFDLLSEGTGSGGSSAHGATNSALGAAGLGAAALGSATATLGSTGNGLDLDFSSTSSGLHLPEVDLDLSETGAADDQAIGDTAEFTAAFAPADRSGATTREMAPQFAPSVPDLEDLNSDLGEAPTVEQPLLRTNSPTIRQKIDAVLRQANTANDQTAEVAIDDLGLDLGDGLDLDPHEVSSGRLSADGGIANLPPPQADTSADAPTLVAGLDAESRDLIKSAAAASGADSTLVNTGEWFTGTKTERDTAATASMRGLDVDLSEHADAGATAQLKRPTDLDLDLAQLPHGDLDNTGTATALSNSEELSLPALEPMTISEVGTKLDLARAYMDMGDPDGARSILKEVLQEGSISQKQEAQRLIDSLPG